MDRRGDGGADGLLRQHGHLQHAQLPPRFDAAGLGGRRRLGRLSDRVLPAGRGQVRRGDGAQDAGGAYRGVPDGRGAESAHDPRARNARAGHARLHHSRAGKLRPPVSSPPDSTPNVPRVVPNRSPNVRKATTVAAACSAARVKTLATDCLEIVTLPCDGGAGADPAEHVPFRAALQVPFGGAAARESQLHRALRGAAKERGGGGGRGAGEYPLLWTTYILIKIKGVLKYS
eukprot:1195318-Prorocentrum_minimum.AAC.6